MSRSNARYPVINDAEIAQARIKDRNSEAARSLSLDQVTLIQEDSFVRSVLALDATLEKFSAKEFGALMSEPNWVGVGFTFDRILLWRDVAIQIRNTQP